MQVDAYASQNSLKLLGYYHAEYRSNATDIHAVGKKVADKLADRNPSTFILAVDSQKLGEFCGVAEPKADISTKGKSSGPAGAAAAAEGSIGSGQEIQAPFDVMLRDASGQKGSWKKVLGSSSGTSLKLASSSSSSGWADLHKRFLNLFAQGVHLQLADFDEHLDDLARDYLNADLLPASTSLISK
jgi:hypothetical protein